MALVVDVCRARFMRGNEQSIRDNFGTLGRSLTPGFERAGGRAVLNIQPRVEVESIHRDFLSAELYRIAGWM